MYQLSSKQGAGEWEQVDGEDVLRDVSFRIERGCLTAMLGPSGNAQH